MANMYNGDNVRFVLVFRLNQIDHWDHSILHYIYSECVFANNYYYYLVNLFIKVVQAKSVVHLKKFPLSSYGNTLATFILCKKPSYNHHQLFNNNDISVCNTYAFQMKIHFLETKSSIHDM